MRKLLTLIIALGFTISAFAGRPYETEQTCPLGDETFKITSTYSCSSLGHMMNLRAITSCDFITRLPQCPGNKLFIYKEFSAAELTQLPDILSSDLFTEASDKSKYYQAYLIEQSLEEPDPITSFFILQQGMWYESSDLTHDDPEFVAAFEKALDTATSDEKFEERNFYIAANAMRLISLGKQDSAKTIIKALKKDDKGENEYYSQYLDALKYCLKNSDNQELCSPTSTIRAHQNKN